MLLQDRKNIQNPPANQADGQSLSERVYEYLSDQFAMGKLGYGDKLNIKQIADRLNMSSMPIRDAIKKLEQEHVVIVNPRSHCYVRIPSKQDILDAIDARRMIEHFAVSTTYRHVRLSDLVVLDRIVEQMRRYSKDDEAEINRTDLEEYIELDRRFHQELCALSRNEYIIRFYRVVNIHLSMNFSYGVGACHGIAATFSEHESIVNSLKAHSDEALNILNEHLMRSRQNILSEESFLNLPD